MSRASQRGGGPGRGFGGELFQEQEREQREHAKENQIPRQRQRRGYAAVDEVEAIEVPRAFQREHAGQADEREGVQREQDREAEQQHDEQQREAEHGRGIGERQPQRDHDEQQERQRGGTGGQQRGERFRRCEVAGEFEAGLERIRADLADEPHAGDHEEDRDRAEQVERSRQPGEVGRDLEDERACSRQREQQHHEHGNQRGRNGRERDGEQIHEQNERPDEE